MKHKTLYKRASTGTVSVWWIESDSDRYRTRHGVEHGEVITSAWTYPTAKNIGKSNETTLEQQTALEVKSAYELKLTKGKYTDDYAKIDEAKESYFSPMLAEKFDPDRIEGSFFVQPKFNGARCIATKDGLFSRTGKEFVNTPHINKALESFFFLNPDRILDGELYNHEYKADFNSLVSAIKKTKPTAATQALAADVVKFYVYDTYEACYKHDNFSARINFLQYTFKSNILTPHDDIIILSQTYRSSDLDTAKGLHKKITDQGYEGTIVRLDEPYECKRTYSLMKYKDFKDEEFEIADIVEGSGNWAGVAKVVWIVLPGRPIRSGDYYLDRHTGKIIKATLKTDISNPNIVRVSKATTKGSKEYCKKLLDNKKDLIGKLGTVVFFDLTPDDVPLFPIFQTVRDYE